MEKGLLICRLCASSDKLINITDKDNLRSLENAKLKNKIYHAIGIEVQNDDVFQKICMDCAETLNDYYIFKEKALKTNEILGEISTIIAADAPSKEVSIMVMRLTERSLSSANEMETESVLKKLRDSIDDAKEPTPESNPNSGCTLQQFSVVNINEREEHDDDADRKAVENDNDVILIEDDVDDEEDEQDDPPFSHLIGEVLETPTKRLIVNDISQEQYRNNITTFDLESDQFISENSNSVDSTETVICSNESPNITSNLVVDIRKIFNKDVGDKVVSTLENTEIVCDNQCENNNSDQTNMQNAKSLQEENTDINKVTSSSEVENVLMETTEFVTNDRINVTTSTEFNIRDSQNNILLDISQSAIEVAEVEVKDVLETDPVVIGDKVTTGTIDLGKGINESNKQTQKSVECNVIREDNCRAKNATSDKTENVELNLPIIESAEVESEEANMVIEDPKAKTGAIENLYNRGNVLSLSNGFELPVKESTQIESREEDMETEEQGVEGEIRATPDDELENLMNAIDENTLIFEEIEKSIKKSNQDQEQEPENGNNRKVIDTNSSRVTTSSKMRSTSKKLICHLCKTRFKTLRKLKVHLNITHPVTDVDKTQCYMEVYSSTDSKSALLVDCLAARDWKYYVSPRVRLINACDPTNLNCLTNFKGIKRVDILNSQRYLKGNNTMYGSLADRIKRRNNISSVKEQSHETIQNTNKDLNQDVKRRSKNYKKEHKREKDRKKNSTDFKLNTKSYTADEERAGGTQEFLLDENSLSFNKFNITNESFEAYMSKLNIESEMPYQTPQDDNNIQGEICNKSKQIGIDLFPISAALSKYKIPKLSKTVSGIQNIENLEITKIPENAIQENNLHDHNDGGIIQENKNSGSANIPKLPETVSVDQIINPEKRKVNINEIQKNTRVDHNDREQIKKNKNNNIANIPKLSKMVSVGQKILNSEQSKLHKNEFQKNKSIDQSNGKEIKQNKHNGSENIPKLSKMVSVGQKIVNSEPSKLHKNEFQKNKSIDQSNGKEIKQNKNNGSENIPKLSKMVSVGRKIVNSEQSKLHKNEFQKNKSIDQSNGKEIKQNKNNGSENIPKLSKMVSVGQKIVNSEQSKLHKNEFQKNKSIDQSNGKEIKQNKNNGSENIPKLSKMVSVGQKIVNSEQSKLHKNEFQKHKSIDHSDGEKVKQNKNNGSENIPKLLKRVSVCQDIIIPEKRRMYINETEKNAYMEHSDGEIIKENKNKCSINIPKLLKTVSVGQKIVNSEENTVHINANHKTTSIDHNERTKVGENKIKTYVNITKKSLSENKSSVSNSLQKEEGKHEIIVMSNGSNVSAVHKDLQGHLKNSLKIINTEKDTLNMQNPVISRSIIDVNYKKQIENEQTNRKASTEDLSSRSAIDNPQSGSSEYGPPRVLYAESYERLKFPAIKHGEPIGVNKKSSINAIPLNTAPIPVLRCEDKKKENVNRNITETVDLTNNDIPELSTLNKQQNNERLSNSLGIIENKNNNRRETVIRVINQATIQSISSVTRKQEKMVIRKVPMKMLSTIKTSSFVAGETKLKNISKQSSANLPQRVVPPLIPIANQNNKINRLNDCNINGEKLLPKLQPCPQLSNKPNQDNIRNVTFVLPTLQPCPKSVLRKSLPNTSYDSNEKIGHSKTRNIGSAGSNLTEKKTADMNLSHTPTSMPLQPNVKQPVTQNRKCNPVNPNKLSTYQVNQNSNGLIKESIPHELINRQTDQSFRRNVVSERKTTNFTYSKQVPSTQNNFQGVGPNLKTQAKSNRNIQNNTSILCSITPSSNSSGITTEPTVPNSSQSGNLHSSEKTATTSSNLNQISTVNYYQFQGQNTTINFVPSIPQTLNEQGPRLAYILNTIPQSTICYNNQTFSVTDINNRTMAAETLLGLSQCFIASAPSIPNGNSNPLVIPQGIIVNSSNNSQITGTGKPDTNSLNPEKVALKNQNTSCSVKTLENKRIDDTNAAVHPPGDTPTSELPSLTHASHLTEFEQYVSHKRKLYGNNHNHQAKKRKLDDREESPQNKTKKQSVGNTVNIVTLSVPGGNNNGNNNNK